MFIEREDIVERETQLVEKNDPRYRRDMYSLGCFIKSGESLILRWR